jgi:ABC-2 type transport system permease protein
MRAQLLTVYSLVRRELLRFVRQRNRVFGALAQPVIFWALFGAGLNPSFRTASSGEGIDYFEYFFPGTVILILLFTAIFATISVIEDRNAGFLQSVLIAPISRASIIAGKIAGTTILAVAQGLLLLAFAPFIGIPLELSSTLAATVLMILIAIALSGLGFSIAWKMDSTQGFHAVMTAFLMPMWFLSGAFFPATGLPLWLKTIVVLNPLTYGLAAFRRVLYANDPALVGDAPALGLSLAITVAFAVAMVALSTYVARDPRPDSAQA